MLSKTLHASTLPRRRTSRGFVLIEALIAILIFSLGVLGLVGLQASLTRATTSAKFRADATYLAQTLIGQMWTDTPNLASYNSCASYAPCKSWYDTVTATLPAAETDVYYCSASDTTDACKENGTVVTTGRVIITIRWTVPGEGLHTFSTASSVNP